MDNATKIAQETAERISARTLAENDFLNDDAVDEAIRRQEVEENRIQEKEVAFLCYLQESEG